MIDPKHINKELIDYAAQVELLTAERDAAREAVINICARVVTLTAERDAYVRSMAVWVQSYALILEQHKIERDELQATITAMCNAIPDYDWGGDSVEKIAALATERDALKAAKLAKDAHEAYEADMLEEVRRSSILKPEPPPIRMVKSHTNSAGLLNEY